jgi:peroxisomal membrane protein 2
MMRLFRLLSITSFLSASCSAFSPMASRSPMKSSSTSVEIPKPTTSTALNFGVQEAWTTYNDALVADPLIVKSVTACVILGAADLTGQAVEAKQKGEDNIVDIARTARFAFFGLVLQAPWNHFYYNILDGAIPPTVEPWTATTGIKVAIDQFVQAPVFTVLIFGFLGFLEGKNFEAIKKQLDDDYADTMVANCKYCMEQENKVAHCG